MLGAPRMRARRWWCSRRRPCAASGCRWRRSPSRWTGHGRRGCADRRRRRHRRGRRHVRPGQDGRVTNTVIATGPGVDAHYDKIHLYDAFGFTESRTVAPGHEPVVITVDGVGVGPDHLLRHSLPGALHRTGRRGAQADHGQRVVGLRPGQARAVDAAGAGAGARLDQLRRRGRSGLSGRRACRGAGAPDRGRRQPRRVAVWARWSPPPARPALLVADIDLDAVARPATHLRCCAIGPASFTR